ncbi:condensation domain-containing protein [Streptomyces sp. G45]|uniref:condensation domain-containing protein n=1 Tax=Streptomyces sp. G45 TaxID=3406627 RepID=UPI003C255F97
MFSAHHVLYDGWSFPLLISDLLRLYGTRGDTTALPGVRGYKEFLDLARPPGPAGGR